MKDSARWRCPFCVRGHFVDEVQDMRYNSTRPGELPPSLFQHSWLFCERLPSVNQPFSLLVTTCPCFMTDLRKLPLADLVAHCQAQNITYLRTRQAGDDRHCLELFRRAVQEDDQTAWAFVYTWYSTEEFLGEHYMLKWVRAWLNGRHGPAIRAHFTEQELVQEIWLRFMRSDAAKTFNFSDMGHLMAFLRRLVNNYALDAARRRAPSVVEYLDENDIGAFDALLRSIPDDHADIEASMVNQEGLDNLLREIVGEIIHSEQEWLVFRSYFLDGLPPRKLYELHPQQFTRGEVEAIRTRLSRRLRKMPYLLQRYIQVVVLEDDERQKVVFDTALLRGWQDTDVLQSHPALFHDQNDLLTTKVRVLEALSSRPLVLKFLGLDA